MGSAISVMTLRRLTSGDVSFTCGSVTDSKQQGRLSKVTSPRLAFVVALWLLLTPRGYVFALDTTLDITQFAHQVWKIRDGFTEGYTESIAQTPDGYLWLGTEFGLIRFDGIRHVLWSPSTGQHLPSSNIRALLAARDGSLWIGTDSGLARWNNRKLTEYRELAGYNVFTLLEDHEGTIWAGGNSLPTGRICAIRQLDIRCDGQDGSLGTGPVSIYEDSQGSLWVGVAAGMWRWKPQPSMLYRVPGQDPVVEALLEGAQGEMILGTNGRSEEHTS